MPTTTSRSARSRRSASGRSSDPVSFGKVLGEVAEAWSRPGPAFAAWARRAGGVGATGLATLARTLGSDVTGPASATATTGASRTRPGRRIRSTSPCARATSSPRSCCGTRGGGSPGARAEGQGRVRGRAPRGRVRPDELPRRQPGRDEACLRDGRIEPRARAAHPRRGPGAQRRLAASGGSSRLHHRRDAGRPPPARSCSGTA